MEQFTETADGLKVLSPAKLNLSILIAGKRPDGYHEIETVMSRIDFYDELVFQPASAGGIELICRGDYQVPEGADNLVYKACRMLYESAGLEGNVRVILTKNIPPGSGLGGASSNAAAALVGLNRLAQLGFKNTELADMAARLGSDVAFFLGPKLAFCTGRGEKIEKIAHSYQFRAILVLPDINVSTKKVYENYVHNQNLYTSLSPQINGLITKKGIDLVATMCANMLQWSCFQLHPELLDLKNRLDSLGIGRFCLTGSGSALYCLADGTAEVLKEYQSMLSERIGCKSIVVRNSRW